MLSYSEFLLNESLIFEGGAYGHLSHPFEDFALCFSDLRELIITTVNGSFSPEHFVQEKTDGQQISVTWKDRSIRAARNKTHLKERGKYSLDASMLEKMFAGRGAIESAFTAAIQDLESSIGALPDAKKREYFQEGKKFLSIEVITPATQNTVPYGQEMLVMHGIIEYDEAGNAIGEDKQAARELAQLIEAANASAQKRFFVRGPNDIKALPFTKTAEKEAYYISKLDKILADSGCNETNTIQDYILQMGYLKARQLAKEAKMNFGEEILYSLGRRIAGIDRSFTVSEIRKLCGEFAETYLSMEKAQEKAWKREMYQPLETLFLEIGTELMKNMSSFLAASPTEATEAMRKEIDAVIAQIRKDGGAADVEKLESELQRLASAGGIENIVPTEGITFVFKGKLYKYTGIFAPIHQIRSILAYKSNVRK